MRNAAALIAASTLLSSIPTHVARKAGQDGEDVIVIGGDGTIPVKDVLERESDLARLSRETDEQVSRGRYLKQEKQPDPERQSAAEAKRARKAARLKEWAAKGAIGVQTAKAPTAKDADKTKLPAKRKAPAVKKAKA